MQVKKDYMMEWNNQDFRLKICWQLKKKGFAFFTLSHWKAMSAHTQGTLFLIIINVVLRKVLFSSRLLNVQSYSNFKSIINGWVLPGAGRIVSVTRHKAKLNNVTSLHSNENHYHHHFKFYINSGISVE